MPEKFVGDGLLTRLLFHSGANSLSSSPHGTASLSHINEPIKFSVRIPKLHLWTADKICIVVSIQWNIRIPKSENIDAVDQFPLGNFSVHLFEAVVSHMLLQQSTLCWLYGSIKPTYSSSRSSMSGRPVRLAIVPPITALQKITYPWQKILISILVIFTTYIQEVLTVWRQSSIHKHR